MRAAFKTYAPTPEVVRVFIPPPCARCNATLLDADGNPRWDVVGNMSLVCLGGCVPAALRRRAELS